MIKDNLKKMLDDGVHGISFTPCTKNKVDVCALTLNEESKKKLKFIQYEIGYLYHIILYKNNKKAEITEYDNFEAVLTGPMFMSPT